MALSLPGIPVVLPPSKPTPVGSLVDSSRTPPPEFLNDPHWTGGIRWNPDACRTGSRFNVGESSAVAEVDAPVMPFEVPFVVEVPYRMSATGNQHALEDGTDKVIRAFNRNVNRLIENEFCDGIVARRNSLNNFFLSNNGTSLSGDSTQQTPTKATDVATIIGDGGATAYKVRKAFGVLEEVTQQGLGGGQCMIHVPIHVVPYLAGFQLIQPVGNLLLTKNGNLVVSGVGYTGAVPGTTGSSDPIKIDNSAGSKSTVDSSWIYGTDLTTVWIQPGDPEVLTSEIREVISDSSGTVQNTLEFRARKFCAVTVNRCVNYAVKLDLANS